MCPGLYCTIHRKITTAHRGREAEVEKNKFPLMGAVPKWSIFHGLSNETCFEKIDGGLFDLRFYTV
jgi:hypothetical protein